MSQVKAGIVTIEVIDKAVLQQALSLFAPHESKQNTMFDAMVAAVARNYYADGIFGNVPQLP